MKYMLFISIRDDTIIANFAELFFKHIKYCFDTFKNIVTDRNFHIISDF